MSLTASRRIELALAKENDVEIALVKTWSIKRLSLFQVDNLTVFQNELDRINIHFAENRMVVLQAYVTHVHLYLFVSIVGLSQHPTSCSLHSMLVILIELLANLEEPFFDFLFDFWLELLLHVVHLQVLAFEMFQWVLLSVVFYLLPLR